MSADRLAQPGQGVDGPLLPRLRVAQAQSESALAAATAPMSPAAFINPAVIHRAAALRAEEDGKPLTPFTYREGLTNTEGVTARATQRTALIDQA